MLVSCTSVLGIAHVHIIAQNGQISHIDHTSDADRTFEPGARAPQVQAAVAGVTLVP